MKMPHLIGSFVTVLMLVLVRVAGSAQQPPGPAQGAAGGQTPPAAARGATAPPAINWPSPPLPDGPIVLDTGIQHQIRLFVTKGLNQPWSMAFLPDGGILVTERPGRLRIVRNGVLDPNPIAGVPAGAGAGPGRPDGHCAASALRGEPADLLHVPQARSRHRRGPAGNAGVITLARGRWNGTALVDVRDIFTAIPSGNASRIIFGKDGMLYMTVGVGDPPGAPRARRTPTTLRARCCGCATMEPFRPTIRLSAAPDTGPRSTRWAIAIRWDWRCNPTPAPSGKTRTVPTAATKSTCCSRARITAGRWSASAGSISDRA